MIERVEGDVMNEKRQVEHAREAAAEQERRYRELQDRFDNKVIQCDQLEMSLRKAMGNLDRVQIDLKAREDILDARSRQVNDLEVELNELKRDYENEKLAITQLNEKL